MNIQIKDMKKDDFVRVSEIYQKGIDSKNCTFEVTTPSWEVFEANHLKFCRFIVVNETQDVIGWAALSPTSQRHCFRGVAEVSIYLDPLVTGRGIGSILLNHLVQESEKNGIWSLISGIFPENTASVHLHQTCGFQQVCYREKMGETVDGIFRDVVFMERRSKVIGI